MLGKQFRSTLVARFHNGTHFFVDSVCHFVAVTFFRLIVSSDKNFAFTAVEQRSYSVAHAPFGNHSVRRLRERFNVAAGTRRDVLNDYLFRYTSAQRHCNFVQQLLFTYMVVVVFRSCHCVAGSHSTGNNGNFMHGVAVFQQTCQNRMSRFVIGGDTFVGLRYQTGFLLRSHDNFVDAFVYVRHCDDFSARTNSQNCRFVQQVFQIGAGESRSNSCHCAEVYIRSYRLFACMYFKYRFSSTYVGSVDVNLSVETAGTQQCRVENICTVGCRHYDYACVGFKTVHFHKQLVERLFTFVMSAAQSCATLTTHCVDFVNKNDAGHVFLCLVKQISYTACAHAHEHFHKVGTAHGKERNARFACHGFCKQRFARSRRTYQQHAFGYTCANVGKLFGIFQKVDDFLQFFLFFIGAGNIAETHLHVVNCLCTGSSEIHILVVLLGNLTEHQHAQQNEQSYPHNGNNVVRPTCSVGVCRGIFQIRGCAVFDFAQDKFIQGISVGSYKHVGLVAFYTLYLIIIEVNRVERRYVLTKFGFGNFCASGAQNAYKHKYQHQKKQYRYYRIPKSSLFLFQG